MTESEASTGMERAEFGCAGSRFENKIYIFGGIDKDFVMTNKTLVLMFDQLHINPLLQEQFQNNQRNSQIEAGVDLQFFSIN